MKTDIEKMLKYQEVDMKRYILDKKLKNAEETKMVVDATGKRKEIKEELNAFYRDIDSEMLSVNKASEDFSSLMNEVNDLENSIGDQINIEQIDYFLKKIDDLMKKVKDLENIGGDSKRMLEKLGSDAESDLMQYAKATKVLSKYMPLFEKLKKEMGVEASQIKKELEDVVANEHIDKNSEIFKVYTKTSKHRMPVFVELNDKNCGGCGVEVPNNVIINTNNNGYAECPNCGRILYKK